MTGAQHPTALPRIAAWSVEAPASEAEFLRREIGLDITVATPDQIARVAQRQPTAVVVSEPDPYLDLVRDAPPGSLVLFMISDEGYSPDRLALVDGATSIRAVFRHYGIEGASLADVAASTWEFLAATKHSSVSPRVVPHLLATGWRTRGRMKRWGDVSVPVHAVPLGYTSDFAHAVIRALDLDLNSGDSLIQAILANPDVEKQTEPWEETGVRDLDTVFRGSPGSAHRQVLVEQAQQQPDSVVEWIDAQWTSVPSLERADRYVASLRRARRALCPPGAVNTETFRFYEAALCGARPVEPRTALTHLGRPIARGAAPLDRIRLALRDVRASLVEALVEVLGDEGVKPRD